MLIAVAKLRYAVPMRTDSRDKQTRTTTVAVTAHSCDGDSLIAALHSSAHGLSLAEAQARLIRQGPNTLPHAHPPGLATVFVRQFTTPLIYVLLAAALFSMVIQEWSDAVFISAVLLINAIIGTTQEFSAQHASAALRQLVTSQCRVIRDNDSYQINTEDLVPGDIVLLESGDRVPADLRLITSHDLIIDESLLTGESTAVTKHADQALASDTLLADRCNMAFTGSLVEHGRGYGIVVATGVNTELGQIASAVLTSVPAKPPLLIRMERFTHRIALIVAVAAVLVAVVAFLRGLPIHDVFLLSVALAVSVIPEGLPVALTVALAVGMHRMAKREVIVRRLVAVEALGSCTFIASDKTGTLTVNQLTVKRIAPPLQDNDWLLGGEGMEPEGKIITANDGMSAAEEHYLQRLCQTAVLANEGYLGHREQGWTQHGDAVDVALLVMAHKASIIKDELATSHPELASIPFESERLFAASLNNGINGPTIHAKGALEKLLPMCTQMAGIGTEDQPIDTTTIVKHALRLAEQGYRVLALATGTSESSNTLSEEHLHGLTFLGLVGITDPLRPEAGMALNACQHAGIQVAMITGDHPSTALAIANELKLTDNHLYQVVTGTDLHNAIDDQALDILTRDNRVFARIEPRQKLAIVESLQRNGHYVAVSGDGANDAPALRAAHVGVAMGKTGTDVARETADIIITDDNFASIVAGVEEGRIAYANVRKVIFLLISTGAAELVLFMLTLLTALPLPLLPVQLLWLNLVTNGIQDVALAFEPGEGHELQHPPRPPGENIFNRLMIERVVISALVIGITAFVLFQSLLAQGYAIDSARNITLLLMVLFENVHVFNSRSEIRSVFNHNPLRNPILLFGTLTAQVIHIAAMYTPWLNLVLRIQPVTLPQWLELLGLALTVLAAMELHKILHKWLGKNFSRAV